MKTTKYQRDIDDLRSPEIQQKFITMLAEGDNLAECCAALRVNTGALFVVRKENEDFDRLIREVQEFRTELMVDSLLNIHEEHTDARMVDAISSNIRWIASKRNRKAYGEKVEVQHNHAIDLVSVIAAAESRVMKLINPEPASLMHSSTDTITVEQMSAYAFDDDVDPLS